MVKSAAQIRRLEKRAESRGEKYEITEASTKKSQEKGDKNDENDENNNNDNENNNNELYSKKWKAAKDMLKALDDLEDAAQNKETLTAKERRSGKRKAEAIAVEESGCKDASELLQWFENNKPKQPPNNKETITKSSKKEKKGTIVVLLSEDDKKKLDTAKILVHELEQVDKSETLNAKERRSAKRKAEAIASEQVDCPVPELLEWYELNKVKHLPPNSAKRQKGNPDKKKVPNDAKKLNPYILFVGQLSFDTTANGIFAHFQKELGKKVVTSETISVRLLTDKTRKNRSRGMAFVQLNDPELLYECLKLHHTDLDGRRINLERSAGGSKHSEGRKEKIKQYRKEQEEYMSETVDKILTEKYASGDIEKGELDDGVVALMKRRSAAVVEASLSEYVEERVKEMDNPSAYLTAMVCRITEEGIENKKIPEKPSRGRGGGHSGNNNKGDNKKRTTDRGDKAGHQSHNKNGSIGNSFTKSSELAKAGVDMTSSTKGDFSRIFPSMNRGRGRGGYMNGRS
mmetsp:Transcript_7885/g.7479  ORF Transcript_7885/g.7479 Transcript_7885/m.7479 type:complete len:516 (-) Transcript_7885:28-1575(-)